MRKCHVDVLIVGAGTAGMSAYRNVINFTSNVLVVESGEYGTMCARSGCMPSKLLIAAAEVAHTAIDSNLFGIRSNIHVDGVAVMERVRRERDYFVDNVVKSVNQWPEDHKMRGRASFLDAHTIQVDDHTVIHAKKIIIANGSHPIVPEEWKHVLDNLIVTSDDIFEWKSLPESVAIFGTGVIGLELAQALHRLKVRVRVFGRSGKVGILSDPVLQELSKEIFSGFVPLEAAPKDVEVTKEEDKVCIKWKSDTGIQSEQFDYLLSATGRKSNLENLNFEKTGIALNDNGIPDFDRQTGRVGNTHIFIAGDVTGGRSILHESADAGAIAGKNSVDVLDDKQSFRKTPLAVVFTDPQMCVAGKRFAELEEDEADFVIGEVSFSNQGRSRVILKNYGSLRLYAQKGTGLVLGAEMLGPAAEHIGHLLAWSIQRGDTVDGMLHYPFYHPVIEEGLRTALKDLRKKL